MGWTTMLGLAVALLLAVYLTVAAPNDALREDFRRRALIAGVVVLVVGAFRLCQLKRCHDSTPSPAISRSTSSHRNPQARFRPGSVTRRRVPAFAR